MTNCLRWKPKRTVPFPYYTEVKGRGYFYNANTHKWEPRGYESLDDPQWESCAPLEIILMCSLEGLK